MSKTRTITLTNEPPVKIHESDWPVIAHGSYSDHDNQYAFQANRTWNADIRVRQHNDGRMIVYGVYDYDTAVQCERGFLARAGVVLDADTDPIDGIKDVRDALTDATTEAGHTGFGPHVSQAARECISDLPAREL